MLTHCAKDALHFMLHFNLCESFELFMATPLIQGYQTLAVYFCYARNWRKVDILAADTVKGRCQHVYALE